MLLGSAGSMDALRALIARFFYSNSIELVPNADGKTYAVHNSKGPIPECIVRVHRGRWRFETTTES